MAAGEASDAPGYFADWFPTLCEATGVSKPDGLDGESLWPVITGGEALVHRKPMVWVYPEYGGQVAVQLGDMKILRRGLKTKKPDEWEVYDVVKDRGETKNLASEKPELIQEAVKILKAQMPKNPLFDMELPEA